MKYSRLQLLKEAFRKEGFFRRIPDLFRMFNAWRKGIYKPGFFDLVLPIIGIAYIISPIDLIPGIVFPGIGALDDLLVLYLILPKLMKELDKFLNWENQKKYNITKVIEVEPLN